MSDSPPKETDVEQSAQSGEEENHMDREQEGTQQGLGDFEVKEQDRWLPIANGQYYPSNPRPKRGQMHSPPLSA